MTAGNEHDPNDKIYGRKEKLEYDLVLKMNTVTMNKNSRKTQ